MNIGLNALGFISSGIGGSETYFRNLVQELQSIEGNASFTLLCNDKCKNEFSLTNPRFQLTSIQLSPGSLQWYVRGILRNTAKIDILNPAIYRCGLDVIHHPFTLLSPSCPKIPSVVTFHDMQHEFYPQFFSSFELMYRKKNYKYAAEKAARIIAISHFTKKNLIERFDVDEHKIDVIYEGCGSEFKPIVDQESLFSIRLKYSLDKPFMYYPAATWPHKNHSQLLRALKILKERYSFDGELILTGIAMQEHGRVLGDIVRLGLGDSVRILGYVPFNDLPYLYNLSKLLVFPSLFEGFGIPLVEAMACGCPIVCSNVTSIPEVVGDAGVMFEPLSSEDMAGKIWDVWNDDIKRESLRCRGFDRIKLFNWHVAAQNTLKVYKQASR